MLGRLRNPRPFKFWAPAEPAREAGQQMLQVALQADLSPKVINQDDLAAGLGDTHELIERRLRVRYPMLDA
jgi:hypothetical protein